VKRGIARDARGTQLLHSHRVRPRA
jgi:hypothetical protein